MSKEKDFKIENNHIYNLDCMYALNFIEDKSIDCIICDLPYGTTACKWDSQIPLNDYIVVNKKKMNLEEYLLHNYKKGIEYKEAIQYFEKNKQLGLWSHYNRIIKDDGAIVLFGSEPFSTALRNSNLEMYKYDWIWEKNTVDGFFNSKCRPLKTIENISVFSKKQARAKGDNMKYYPQGLIAIEKEIKDVRKETNDGHKYYRESLKDNSYTQKATNYPKEILKFNRDTEKLHPTQKPIALCEYLVKTYTNEGEIILDNCMGSGSTIVACINSNRKYIGIEKDKKIFDVASQRIKKILENKGEEINE